MLSEFNPESFLYPRCRKIREISPVERKASSVAQLTGGSCQRTVLQRFWGFEGSDGLLLVALSCMQLRVASAMASATSYWQGA